jgi:hypothetical protein
MLKERLRGGYRFMRQKVTLASLFSLLLAISLFAHYPDKVQVDIAAKKQPPVVFNHALHGDKLVKTCETCHHTEKGLTKAKTDTVDVKKCSECHLNPTDPKVPNQREMSLTKNPFHVRCINCHKSEKKGPTACTGCHVKK